MLSRYSVRISFVVLLLLLVLVYGRYFPLRGKSYKKIRRKTPGCVLGGKAYDLEEKWSPVIEPVGVMVCVKCECQPIIRNSVLQKRGRIKCRNIKRLCPRVSCHNAIIKEGECCKRCSGEGRFEDTFDFKKRKFSMETNIFMDDEHDIHFTSLMVGIDQNSAVTTRSVAWARFTIEGKSTIKYIIYYKGGDIPTHIRIFLHDRTLVFEQTAILSDQKKSKVICGKWSKVPSIYLKYLQATKLYVAISTKNFKDGEVIGRITRFAANFEEHLVSPLRSYRSDGSGGIGLISHNSGHSSKLHILISVRGILSDNDPAPKVQVTFIRKMRVNKPLITLTLPVKQKNTIEIINPPLGRKEMRWLARGRLLLQVISDRFELHGKILPVRLCSPLQSVLSGSFSPENVRTGAAGAAIFHILESGKLSYQIRFLGLTSRISQVTLEVERPRRKSRNILRNLNAPVVYDGRARQHSGWVNGTYRKTRIYDLRMILRGHTFINVHTEIHRSGEIRGRLLLTSYTEHRQAFTSFPAVLELPLYLRGSFIGAAGLAWLGIDRECRLHYEVFLQGIVSSNNRNLVAHFIKKSAVTEVDSALSQKSFRGFRKGMAKGEIRKLSEDLYRSLDHGDAFLIISYITESAGELQAQVKVPNSCWLMFGDQQFVPRDRTPSSKRKDLEIVNVHDCRYNGKTHSDGESWIPNLDPICSTCSCQRGMTHCERMICPKLSCPRLVYNASHCCPYCPTGNSSEACYFDGDKRFYLAGTSWYPYVPPFGYVTCALCECVISSAGSKVVCNKIQCRQLNCPESVSVRVNGSDCCRKCPDNYTEESKGRTDLSLPGDTSMLGACTYAGMIKTDGEMWVPLFSEHKCIQCTCKNGRVSCSRRRCAFMCSKVSIHRRRHCCLKCLRKKINRLMTSR